MDNFNDGVIYVVKDITKVNEFGARINITDISDIKEINHFFYKEETVRQQDLSFAHSIDRKVSMKVSIPYVNDIKSNYFIRIDNCLYSIVNVDPSKLKNKTYIYLEEVRELGRQEDTNENS